MLPTNGPSAIDFTPTNAACGLDNGSFVINGVTGGVAPYTYSIDGGGFTGTTSYTNLAVGTYAVTVRDANGCEFTDNVNIATTNGPSAIDFTPTNAACGLDNGSFVINGVTGGVAPYTYSIDGGGFTGTTSYTNLAVGTYAVTVRDANGCEFTDNVNIATTNGPSAIDFTPTNAACGLDNGSFVINGVTGGVAPYTYSIDGGGFTGTTSYTNLAVGTYAVTVRDANGCEFTDNVNIATTNGPSAIDFTPTNAACGLDNGSFVINGVTGGVAPYTYSIDGGGFTGTTSYTNLAVGTYAVTVRDANGCEFTDNVNIATTNGPSAIDFTPTNAACGLDNGSFVINGVTGGVAPYTYSIDGGGFTGTTSYTNLAVGTYAVTVRDANGCEFTDNVNIATTNGPSAIDFTPTNAACGLDNGSFVINGVTGGVAPYTYSIDGGGFTGTTSYTNLAVGTYAVTVRDANGCEFTDNVNIATTNGPSAIDFTPTNAACGLDNGSFVINGVTGGVAPYTYSIDGGGFTGTTSYTNLAVGTYAVTVRDANGCEFTDNVNIATTNGPSAIDFTPTNAACGLDNGSFVINGVTGGVAPYTYSIDGGGFTGTTSYTNLAVGTYAVTVRDANGCEFTDNVNIATTNGPSAIDFTPTNAACGLDNGSFVINGVTGGVAPYTYSIDGGGFTGTTSYTNLAVGTYAVTVRDANGCEFTDNVNIATSNGPSAIDFTPTNAACGLDNGSFVINGVTGGVAPYTYSIDGGGFTGTTSYTNLAVGTYAVTVRDANGCEFTDNVNIATTNGPSAIDFTPTNAACGLDNGSFVINGVTGGVAPYTYSIDGGGFTGTTSYTNLAVGTYAVTVRDANGCEFTDNVNIATSNGPSAIDFTPTNAACGLDNGSISISGTTGGTGPYSYNIDGGTYGNTTSFTNLAAGAHTIGVQDANGCTFSEPVTIGSTECCPTGVDLTPTDAACGQNNGSITIGAVTGGVGPFTYSIDGGLYTSTTVYPNLSAGTHTIDVKDANDCVFNASVTINTGTGPTAADITPTDAACNQNNGSITINGVTGGSAPYEYSVDGGGYSGTTNYPNLSAGNHTVDVRDANGCVFSTTVTITSGTGPTAADITPTDAACNQNNGSITINGVTGGAAPYEYSVDGGGYSGTTNYPDLSAGNHTVDVRDANGCVFSTTVTITSGTGPTAADITPTDAACNQNNGSITINGVTGGAAPYEYSIDGGGYSGTTNYPNLAAGNHTVDVRDANGCVFSTTVTITSGTGPTAADITPTDAACNQNNGSITINGVTGGAAPYEYSIDGGGYSGTTNYPNLAAGNHTVDVRDANGCVFSTTVTITSGTGPTAADITPTDAACNQNNGSITINGVTGGATPYEYSVDGGGYSGTTNYPGLSAGNHTVDVRDANGCVFSTTVTITSGTGPTAADITPTDAACNQNNGSITINGVTGGAAPYEYSVDGGGYSGTTNYPDLHCRQSYC